MDNSVGIKIETQTDKTIQNLNQVINKLDKTNTLLSKISNNNGFTNSNTELKNTSKLVDTINNGLSKISKLKNSIGLGALVAGFSKLGKETSKLIESSASYIENLNLMQVAFQDTRDEAEGLVNGLSDIFGLDESVMTRQLGYYRQIGNALAIDSSYADLLANNLLKMQLDMSSLYNLSFERSGEVLQASMAGQTKPIRGSTGADITQSSLQTDLDRLGINKAVTDLNRAEKSILIYLSLERQLAASQGDLAKTINTTANQQKIFTEQVDRLSRALGNTLSPAFTKVLTYANGFLMVIVELINMFAKFIGFEIPEYDADSYGLPDYFDDVAESAEAANNKLGSLRSFDKLNNIKTPTSGGSGSGGSGLVDSRLLEALTEYDLKLDGIQNKATQIRDTIMEWLGFTKKVNSETGEITWKYDTLGKSVDQIAKEIGTNLGKALTKYTNSLEWKNYGKTIAKGLNVALSFVTSFLDNYSFVDLGKGIANLINGTIEDADWTMVGKTLSAKFKTTISTLYGLISNLNWSKIGTAVGNAINGAIQNIDLTMIAKGFNNLVSGLFDALVNAIKTINWGEAFKEIINGFSELNTLGKTFITYKLATSVLNLGNALRVLTDGAILSNVTTMSSQFGTLGKNLLDYIKLGQASGYSTGKSIGLGLKYAWEGASNLTKNLVGAGGLIAGLSLVNDSMKSIIQNGQTVGNTFETIGGLATSFFTGFMAWGGTGGVISLLLTGLESLYSLSKNLYQELANIDEKNLLITQEVEQLQTKLRTAEVSYGSILKDINDNVEDTIKNFDYASKVVDQLDGLVDANGKVVGSVEEVKLKLDILNDTLGTEYEITDGVITLNGEKVGSYEDLKDSVQKYCEKLKAEIYLEAYKEKAVEATKKLIELNENQKNAQERLNGVTETIKGIEEERNTILEKYGGNVDKITGKDKTRFDQLGKQLQSAKTDWENWNSMVDKNSEEIGVYQGVIDSYTEAAALNAQGKTTEAINTILGVEQNALQTASNVSKGAITGLQFAIGSIGQLSIPVKATIDTSAIDKWTNSLKKNTLTSTLAPIIEKFLLFKGYANGGFPEDGWFRASKGEYFGQFDDGTSYIANNKQITDGIRQATSNGMMDAFAMQMTSGNKQNINVTIVAEDDGILNAIKFKEKDRDRQYGL